MRWVLILLASTLVPKCKCDAQQLSSQQLVDTPAVIAEAESSMVSFAEARRSFPSEWAMVSRAQYWSGNESSFRISELFLMSANVKQQSFFGFGHRIQADSVVQPSAKVDWHLQLKRGLETYRRAGFDNKFDRRERVDTNGFVLDTDRKSSPLLAPLDLFNFAISDSGSFHSGRVNEAQAVNFFLKNEILVAAKSEAEIVGIWSIGQALAEVHFSRAQHNYPTRIVWRVKNGDDIQGTLKQGRIYSETTTEWIPVTNGDEPVLVPRRFVCLANGASTADTRQSELEVLCDWRFGKEEEIAALIPARDDESWTSPFLSSYSLDFSVGFETFREEFLKGSDPRKK